MLMAARKEEGKGEGVSEAVCLGTRHPNSKALLQWPMSFYEAPPPPGSPFGYEQHLIISHFLQLDA